MPALRKYGQWLGMVVMVATVVSHMWVSDSHQILIWLMSFFAAISTTSDYNRVNVFFIKYDVLVFVPLQVFVMYQNILASLIVNCSRVYKARPTAYLTYFHLSRTSVVCILQDMVTPFPNVSIVCVKTLLFPDAYFIFVTVNFRVWFVFLVFFYLWFGVFSFFFCFNTCACHLLFLLIKRYHHHHHHVPSDMRFKLINVSY